MLRNAPEDLALLLLPPPVEPGAFELRVARPEGGPARKIAIRATGPDGRLIAREEMTIAAGETLSKHRMRLPAEMRNRIARLDIEGQSSAGAAILLDEGWRQRPIGLVGQEEASATQPLLGDLFYLERALAPYAELHRGSIDTLVQSKQAVIVLADVGTLSESDLQKLKIWVDKGGVLLRFAGNWLAQKPDELLPVQLRGTDRAMGGAMSWSEPLTLSAFPQQSPFAGLPVPDDVVVRRQVLAEPDINLGDKTWARLSDGTPLVTGARRGDGWVVLVHTTANADWSTLALSGLFVQMLQRLIGLSQGVADTESAEAIPPLQTLDGLGRLGTPPAAAVAITAKEIEGGHDQPAPSPRLLRPRRYQAGAESVGDHQGAEAAADAAGAHAADRLYQGRGNRPQILADRRRDRAAGGRPHHLAGAARPAAPAPPGQGYRRVAAAGADGRRRIGAG